ncbi:MAG: hypothetical protein DMG15_02540 [Acidobacteria bacterium]|nr:MAG: hypothetical protein DMG15_02540 [Acidobacteriota bacterium]
MPARHFWLEGFRKSGLSSLLRPSRWMNLLQRSFRSRNSESVLSVCLNPGKAFIISSRPFENNYLAEQSRLDPRIVIRTARDIRSEGYENVYGKSSVLVHPSLGDGFAYVVTEAMASGIPVIVTQTTGAAELVIDGKNGYVVPPRDSEAILERLMHLANSPSLLREMGRAARQTMSGLNMDRFRGRLIAGLAGVGGNT